MLQCLQWPEVVSLACARGVSGLSDITLKLILSNCGSRRRMSLADDTLVTAAFSCLDKLDGLSDGSSTDRDISSDVLASPKSTRVHKARDMLDTDESDEGDGSRSVPASLNRLKKVGSAKYIE